MRYKIKVCYTLYLPSMYQNPSESLGFLDVSIAHNKISPTSLFPKTSFLNKSASKVNDIILYSKIYQPYLNLPSLYSFWYPWIEKVSHGDCKNASWYESCVP